MTREPKAIIRAGGEFLIYVGDDGASQDHVRFEEGTVWLTQKLIADLYQVPVPTVNEHLRGIYEDSELEPAPTIRKFRVVRTDGNRKVSRMVDQHGTPAILARLRPTIRDFRMLRNALDGDRRSVAECGTVRIAPGSTEAGGVG